MFVSDIVCNFRCVTNIIYRRYPILLYTYNFHNVYHMKKYIFIAEYMKSIVPVEFLIYQAFTPTKHINADFIK